MTLAVLCINTTSAGSGSVKLPTSLIQSARICEICGLTNPESLKSAKDSSAKPATGNKSVKSRKVSPGTAVLYSALIPGGGQYYTGNTWKGLAIGGVELTFAGLAVAEQIIGAREQKQGDSDAATHFDLRNTFLWWTGFSLGFSMADAYVSASLYGFKQEQRLDALPGGVQLGVAFRF